MLKPEYFDYIIAINKAGSINRAADQLYLSQPYLSIVVKNMEDYLGVKLFDRSNRGVTLTNAGKEFLDISKRIVKLIDEAEHIGQKYSDTNKDFKVASMPSFTMMDLMRSYKIENDSELEYTEMPNNQIINELKDGNYNIGLHFVSSNKYFLRKKNLRDIGINFTPLVDEPLCIVVNKNNPLYNKERVYLVELSDFNFLTESIKVNGEKYPVENNPFPDIFKVAKGMPKFNNNRSMLYYLTKTDNCYCVGQRSLNTTNPFFEMGLLKYIPIVDIKTTFITGYLTSEHNESSDQEERFISYIDDYFKKYNDDPDNNNYITHHIDFDKQI